MCPRFPPFLVSSYTICNLRVSVPTSSDFNFLSRVVAVQFQACANSIELGDFHFALIPGSLVVTPTRSNTDTAGSMGLAPQLDVDYHSLVSEPLKTNYTWWKTFSRKGPPKTPAPPPPAPQEGSSGSRTVVVCISDTHGHHRQLDMPPGDILIHAGDYSMYGSKEDAVDFNLWLGELPYKHRIVVQGNHECNAPWKVEAQSILSNATLLQNELITVENLNIFGTGFFWNFKVGRNPYYDLIPAETDILVAHNPAQGYVDGRNGCPVLLMRIKEVRPKLVVSGHIHYARDAIRGDTPELQNTVFVNAATAESHGKLTKQPVVIRI